MGRGEQEKKERDQKKESHPLYPVIIICHGIPQMMFGHSTKKDDGHPSPRFHARIETQSLQHFQKKTPEPRPQPQSSFYPFRRQITTCAVFLPCLHEKAFPCPHFFSILKRGNYSYIIAFPPSPTLENPS
jgi:hypothetical protein